MSQNQDKAKAYKPEFKEFSVKMAIGSGKPIAQTAKDLGVSPNTLHTWINKYSRDKLVGESPQTDGRLHKELKRLKNENTRLKNDLDTLRKAAACFAGVLAV